MDYPKADFTRHLYRNEDILCFLDYSDFEKSPINLTPKYLQSLRQSITRHYADLLKIFNFLIFNSISILLMAYIESKI